MEAWTDGRHAEDDKLVELDHELAVALVNVTEGAARASLESHSGGAESRVSGMAGTG